MAPRATTLANISSNAGSYSISVSGGEDDNYDLIYVDGILTINPASQIINFDKPADLVESVGKFNLTASADSGLTVEFTSVNTDKISISGATATVRLPGSVTIVARQLGSQNFLAAPVVSRTFCINPKKPTISSLGEGTSEVVLVSSGSAGNQWYRNQIPIEEATNFNFKVLSDGIYQTRVTIDGCFSEISDGFNLIITSNPEPEGKNFPSVFPNPSNGEVFIKMTDVSVDDQVVIELTDGLGRILKSISQRGPDTSISIFEYGTGIYFLKIKLNNRTYWKKIMKQ